MQELGNQVTRASLGGARVGALLDYCVDSSP